MLCPVCTRPLPPNRDPKNKGRPLKKGAHTETGTAGIAFPCRLRQSGNVWSLRGPHGRSILIGLCCTYTAESDTVVSFSRLPVAETETAPTKVTHTGLPGEAQVRIYSICLGSHGSSNCNRSCRLASPGSTLQASVQDRCCAHRRYWGCIHQVPPSCTLRSKYRSHLILGISTLTTWHKHDTHPLAQQPRSTASQ